jgi:phosphohistidine phosphatase SixA
MILALAVGFTALGLWLTSGPEVPDLGLAGNMANANLQARWARGEVVVMVRHAERCDRSKAQCLGAADGITVDGSLAATAAGVGLQHLGLQQAQVFASPLTRTRQTAEYMFGKAAETREWLAQCDKGFAGDVIAHKVTGKNLVLVTHSGCVDQFERHLHVPGGERSSAYAQALFATVDSSGKARILGTMNAYEWQRAQGKATP